MNTFSLLKNTSAYKIFKCDKENQTLSHAYLIVCEDEGMLDNYLSVFAKALLCSEIEPCNNCRVCNLIDSKTHSDVVFYPTSANKIVTSDIDELIEKSYFKPLELDKKLFVLKDASTMTVQAQNKLLKTLEEPPKNTYILMGTTSIYPLLSTILSRCKRLDIMPFLESELLSFLQEGYDREKLLKAIRLSNGKLSEVLKRYQDSDSDNDSESLAILVLENLKSSKQVAEFSSKIKKETLKDFVSALSIIINSALNYSLNGVKSAGENIHDIQKISSEISVGALIYIQDIICEAEKSLHFNGNFQAIVDSLLFGILEGKYKWSK